MLSKLIALIVVAAAGAILAASLNAETSTAQEASTSVPAGTSTAYPEVVPSVPVETPLAFQVFKERRVAKLQTANRIRKSKGYYSLSFKLPSYAIAPLLRDDNLRYWNQRIDKARQLPRKCGRTYCTNLGVRLGLAVWNFRNRSDSQCVRAHEASYQEWTNPIYDGAWQADNDFELYGREGMRRWGHMNDYKPDWPAWAQDAMAYRGWSSRGWSPWPTYARYCA